jgi:hypothetical protein
VECHTSPFKVLICYTIDESCRKEYATGIG